MDVVNVTKLKKKKNTDYIVVFYVLYTYLLTDSCIRDQLLSLFRYKRDPKQDGNRVRHSHILLLKPNQQVHLLRKMKL